MARARRHVLAAGVLLTLAAAAWAEPVVFARPVNQVSFRVIHLRRWVQAASVPADVVCNANYFWQDVPLGLIVQDGRLVNRGLGHKPPRAALVVQDVGGKRRIRITEVWERSRTLYSREGPLKGVHTLVQAGPRLLTNGRVTVNRTREGFRWDVARRTRHIGIGLTADGRVLVVAQPDVNLWEFAATFQRLGARDAMNLDGGSSVTLAVGRKVRIGSGRILAGLAIDAQKPGR